MALFSILQLSYLGYASMALQKAAFSLVRDVARTGDGSGPALQARLLAALSPLAALNRTCWASVVATRYEKEISLDGSEATIHLHYPMPIWVPLAGRFLGEPFPVRPGQDPGTQEAQRILRRLGIPFPPVLTADFRAPNIRWLTYTATAQNEGSRRKDLHEIP